MKNLNLFLSQTLIYFYYQTLKINEYNYPNSITLNCFHLLLKFELFIPF